MGIDEVGTLAALKGHRRERIDPSIARHRGRIVKTTGDGLLAEFASVVDAVSCAVAIQRAMLAFNAGIHIDRQIVLRIGINIGDVIIDGADIFGDGVNVAARLEALCEPGGICISRSANEQVRDRLALRFADLGEQTVKNIARAVGVFGLAAKDIAALSEEELPQTEATALVRPPRWNRAAVAATAAVLSAAILGAGGWWAYHGRTAASSRSYTMGELPRMSVAVLPFENLGADAKDDHLADGITADLTTDLSHIPDVIVVARDSAATRARLRMSVGLARNWASATWSMAAYRGSATHSESTLGSHPPSLGHSYGRIVLMSRSLSGLPARNRLSHGCKTNSPATWPRLRAHAAFASAPRAPMHST
jgi:adenylate cyclase